MGAPPAPDPGEGDKRGCVMTTCVQAASFYMPYILYKFAHDNRIPNLIQDLQNTKPFNEIRDDKLGDIHIYLQVSTK